MFALVPKDMCFIDSATTYTIILFDNVRHRY